MEEILIKSLYPECKTLEDIDELFIKCFDKKPSELDRTKEKIKVNLEECFNNQYKEKRFFNFYGPIILETIERVRKSVFRIGDLAEKKEALFNNVINQFLNRIIDIVFRTMVFEIKRAKESNKLIGETSEERYYFFEYKLLKDNDYRNYLYDKYNNLLMVIKKNADNFAEYIDTLVDGLLSDYEEIVKYIIGNKELGLLTGIEMSAGDVHRNGKSVSLLFFQNGKIVYKPRNCKVDSEFQNLLEFYNEKCELKEKIKPMKILDKDEYGWFEYIKSSECISIGEVKQYYYKLGELLTLLYCLNANDFHQENIIAAGSNPYLIDLETLLNPELKYREREFDIYGAHVKALDMMKTSVYNVGLLPNVLKIGDREEKLYLGGTAGEENQTSPIKTLRIVNDKTDNIDFTLDNFVMIPEKNLPRIANNSYSIINYKEDFINGFSDSYEKILENKTAFLEYVLKKFRGAKVRVILKSTYIYAQLGSISKHPIFQTNKADNRLILARIGLYENNKNVIKSETESMSMMEIPYFYTSFDDEEIYDFLDRPMDVEVVRNVKDSLKNKIERLSKKDFELQNQIINGALFKENLENLHTSICKNAEGITDIDKSKYILTACEIADYFCDTAICGQNDLGYKDAVWIGSSVEHADYNNWAYGVGDMNLYNGNAGICLFLINVWKCTGEKKYLEYANYAAEPIYRVVNNKTFNYTSNTGGFIGVGSLLYTLQKIAQATNAQRYYVAIIEGLDAIDEIVDNSNEFDIISGDMGLMAVLINLLEDENLSSFKNILTEKITNILEKLKREIKSNQKIIEYSGYAHGIAGMIPVLYRYYAITGNEEVLKYMKYLLNYERTKFYMSDICNWRKDEKDDNYGKAWCHGSPGILLEKIQLKALGYEDNYLDDEIKIALKNVLDFGLGNNIPLCHGDMGNIEILTYAANILKDEDLIRKCDVLFDDLYQKQMKDKWCIKTRASYNYKGIMLGLSGQGYTLIRRANNKWKPEVLALM